MSLLQSCLWDTVQVPNSLKSLENWHQKWVEDGCEKKRGKEFQNMQHSPLLSGDPDSMIIDLIPPPELHLLLGVTDKLLTEFALNVFPHHQGKDFLTSFYKDENITVSGRHGGKLNGNASRKVLRSMDSFEEKLKQHSDEHYVLGLPYITTLRNFCQVVTSCFGMELLPGWSDSLEIFEMSYKQLKSQTGKSISITPKVNI